MICRLALAGSLLALFSALPVMGQDYCQLQTSDNYSGYQMRGDRCEGIYAQDVSANLLQVISFATTFNEFASASPDRLQISWRDAGSDTLWIAGRGRSRNSFYGLDTRVPAGRGEFSWPAKILLDKGFRKRSLGFLAFQPADDPASRVHVPIKVSHSNAKIAASNVGYELVIRPGAAFKEIYLGLDRRCGDNYIPVSPQASLGRDFYSAQRVQHRIEVPGSGGVYRLLISAQDSDGVYAPPRAFHFLHHGGTGERNHCEN